MDWGSLGVESDNTNEKEYLLARAMLRNSVIWPKRRRRCESGAERARRCQNNGHDCHCGIATPKSRALQGWAQSLPWSASVLRQVFRPEEPRALCRGFGRIDLALAHRLQAHWGHRRDPGETRPALRDRRSAQCHPGARASLTASTAFAARSSWPADTAC